MDSPSPSVDQFAEILSQEPEWYSLGVFLGAPTSELKEIGQNYANNGIVRCLIELYGCLEKKGTPLSWETIATALRRMGNNSLADKIHSNYILPFIRRISSVSSKEEEEDTTKQQHQQQPMAMDRSPNDSFVKASGHTIKDSRVEEVGGEFLSLSERFVFLTSKIKRSFKASTVDTEELQDLIEGLCGLVPLPQDQATFEAVFKRLKQHCSILNFRVLVLLVENLLSNEENLQRELAKLTVSVENFKRSAKMIELVSLIKESQNVPSSDQKKVKLKVREFWNQFTMKQFETVINEILDTLYDRLSHITVGKGCICVSWDIPDHINASKLVPELSLEFVQIIGVISLHVGDTVIYDIGEEGCETIEAAMLQAIELKNTRAVELLLAVGCSPEVATYVYNEDNAVTTIVNIREKSCDSSGSGGVDHVCILGHNEHVEAIVDPSREQADCSSCRMKEKMMMNIQQEIDVLCQQAKLRQIMVDEVSIEYDALQRKHDAVKQLRMKLIEDISQVQKTEGLSIEYDTSQTKQEITLLKRENEALIKQMNLKDEENQTLRELNLKGNEYIAMLKEKIFTPKSTAVLPRQRLGIGAEMKVKVISNKKELTNDKSAVRATLTCNREECPVTDNGDGMYLVSVVPQQLGQHQLSITVNGQHIQDSPFTLNIVPRCNYTKLKDPVQIITGINGPQYIAFSDNGDMFVTSSDDHCIHVYDESGNEKTTIGSKGRGELQFKSPLGIDIDGEVVYVAEYGRHRIHKLTTGGEFIGIFGMKGSGIGQFIHPRNVKISPDGMVYVADSDNNRIQVFNPDWTISHVVDGKNFCPTGIAFDLSGNVHVAGHDSFSVTVFTPNGQFVYKYDGHINRPGGVTIDSSGYSLVTNAWDNGSLSVYDPTGRLIHSMKGFHFRTGVSISPDGSVWVADTHGNRLLKY